MKITFFPPSKDGEKKKGSNGGEREKGWRIWRREDTREKSKREKGKNVKNVKNVKNDKNVKNVKISIENNVIKSMLKFSLKIC